MSDQIIEITARLSDNDYADVLASNISMKDVNLTTDGVTCVRGDHYMLNDEWFYHYHSYDEIVAKLGELSNNYSEIVRGPFVIGKSYEGRDIVGVQLGNGTAQPVILMAGQHAREWMSEAVIMWILGYFLQENVLLDPSATFFVVPCCNPDGYEYSRLYNRLWRKNRRRNDDGSYGVDLNRNWGIAWSGVGSSKRPSSETYCGTTPFSEPETFAMSQWILKINPIGLIDFHSYGSMILRPYGYQRQLAANDDTLKLLGEDMVRDIQAESDTFYRNVAAWELYLCGGASDDWSYEDIGVPYVYTIEIDGKSFTDSESNIPTRAHELYCAIKRYLSALRMLEKKF